MINIKSFTFNNFQENTYIVWDDTNECVIIDPGCYELDEKRMLSDFISAKQLKPKYLLNTHCHIDHILGNQYVKQQYKVNLLIHYIEKDTLRMAKLYAQNYGFPNFEESEADVTITEKDIIRFGNTELYILFLPGHAPGHVAFVDRASKNIIVGDVLFYHSIGRTDLPGGHHQTLLDSINNKLFLLEDEYAVYPGHGKPTTIGEERENNPYLMPQ